jgi:O-antigen/teichoic acid export membrane protein
MVVMTGSRGIRVRYAGAVNFASKLVSTLTGLIFVTMVSRRLSEEEFGLWSFFGVWLQYFVIPSTFVNYWVVRYASRGFRVGKTSLILTSILTLASMLVFMVASQYILYSNISLSYLQAVIMVLLLQIPAEYFASNLDAIVTALAPEFTGYGGILLEIVKLSSGFILVNYYRLGLVGALLSYVIAKYFYSLFLFIMFRGSFNGSFDSSLAFKWVKLSWLPAYSIIPGYVRSLETPIITFLIRFPDPSTPFRVLAHLKAVSTISSVISYAGMLSSALYPKILSGGSREDVESALKYVLMFAFPMVFGVLAMSETFLSLLRAEYAVSYQALYLGAISVLPSLVAGVLSSAIIGFERVDVMDNVDLRDYLTSKLFTYPSISLALNVLYIFCLYLVFNAVSPFIYDPSMLVSIWILLGLIVNLILCLKFYLDSKRIMGVRFPWANVSKYMLSSVIMFSMLYLSGFGAVVSREFVEVFKYSLFGVALGAMVYGITLMAFDVEFRRLIQHSISWFRSRIFKGKFIF